MAAQHNEHLTNEQLSALLDGELERDERIAREAHLRDCPDCQRALAELRLTVNLLHALPQPALPRSFALPTDARYPQERRATERQPVAAAAFSALPVGSSLARPTPPARRSRSFWRGSVRVASSLAAVIGLFFLLSALLPFALQGHSTGSASTSQAPASTSSGTSKQSRPHAQGARTPAARTPGTANSDTPVVTPIPTPQPTPTVASQPTATNAPPSFDVNTPGTRLLLGSGLLLLGILGIVLTRRRRE